MAAVLNGRALQALRERLRSGSFSDEDIEQAHGLVKGLREGTLDVKALRKGMDGDGDADDEGGAPDGDADDETCDDCGLKNCRCVKKGVETEIPGIPMQEPHSIRKAVEQVPGGPQAINGLPVLEALLKGVTGLNETVNALVLKQSEDQLLIKSLRADVAALTEQVKAAPGAGEQVDEGVRSGELRKSVGQDTDRALEQVLKSFGVLNERLEEIEDKVERRPFTGNPPRTRELSKALRGGAALTKERAITSIQKALQTGALSGDEASNALAQLDIVDTNRRAGGEATYEQVCKAFSVSVEA